MNMKSPRNWQPAFGKDNVAYSITLAASVIVVLLAAATADSDPAPPYAQAAQAPVTRTSLLAEGPALS
jgi:hypothetical protein